MRDQSCISSHSKHQMKFILASKGFRGNWYNDLAGLSNVTGALVQHSFPSEVKGKFKLVNYDITCHPDDLSTYSSITSYDYLVDNIT